MSAFSDSSGACLVPQSRKLHGEFRCFPYVEAVVDCFGSVMGAMNLVVMPFSIIAIRFIGEVFDRTGGYNPAFMVFIMTAVVSALLVLMVKPSRGLSLIHI